MRGEGQLCSRVLALSALVGSAMAESESDEHDDEDGEGLPLEWGLLITGFACFAVSALFAFAVVRWIEHNRLRRNEVIVFQGPACVSSDTQHRMQQMQPPPAMVQASPQMEFATVELQERERRNQRESQR